MDEKILFETLQFMFKFDKSTKVIIDFLGGEPLLKKDLIYKAVDYIKEHYPERVVKYYITTNCSLLDEQFIAFMVCNDFNVRLSFDGCKQAHDLNRQAKDGSSCYETIFKQVLKIRDSGLRYSVRMTVTANTIPYMYENIKFFHKNNLDSICMIPDVNLEFNTDSKNEFSKQVEKITTYYIEECDKGRKFALDQFDGKFLNLLCDFGNCFSMCDAGISNFKIMPDGKVYPCGFLTNDEKYVIGNIYDTINIRRGKEIALSNYDKKDRKCKDCKIRDFCHGMKCGYMNFIRTGSINIPSDDVCTCEHIFYPQVIRILKYLINQPRDKFMDTFSGFIKYIEESDLKLSEYGKLVQEKIRK